MAELGEQDQLLVTRAIEALASTYSPYSKYPVGCALRDENGRVHVGVNVENAAYPAGTCAEAGAIAAMVAAGGRKISAIAVSGAGEDLTTPCGACRQRIREFAPPGLDLPVYICSPQGVKASFTLGKLLPESFGPENLTV